MSDKERYSMRITDIGQHELDLLECLLRIDAGGKVDPRADSMVERLIDAGLANSEDGRLTLTYAGVERTQSLQHRVAGDGEAAKVLNQRSMGEENDT
jgi:hypothetical protein